MKSIQKGEYTITQERNKHISLYKNDKLILHIAAKKKWTDAELLKQIEGYEKLAELLAQEKMTLPAPKDTYTVKWYPLPAPSDRFVLVRFKDPDEPVKWACEMAFSVDGINFLDDANKPFYTDVEAWAFFPYDEE